MSAQSTVFANPPVNEVIVSTYFDPPLTELRSEHIGLFWAEIRDEFTQVKQQPPLPGRQSIVANETFPMPRYWFIANNEINLIQIQRNAFIFNWRRRDEDYPRYHHDIKVNFDKYYGLFTKYLDEKDIATEPTVDMCELSYINSIESCDYWSIPDHTPVVIPSFKNLNPGIDMDGSQGFNCNFLFDIEADLKLNIGVSTRVNSDQPSKNMLMFEIRAQGSFSRVAKSSTDEWFERAHDTIEQCFLRMTAPEIQRNYWNPIEDSQ